MASEYFSHDCDAQFDDKCVRLLQVLGWKGYGVYWGLVERLSKREDCALEYNPKGLAWSLHISEKYLIRVLTEFNLFTISEDGTRFWSESARRRRAMRYKKTTQDPTQPKRKPGRPRKYPRPEDVAQAVEVKPQEDPKTEPNVAPEPVVDNLRDVAPTEREQEPVEKASGTPQNDVSEQALSIYQPEQNNDAKTQESASYSTISTNNQKNDLTEDFEPDDAVDESSIPTNEIIRTWNQIFKGTPQAYRGLYLDSISYQRAKESFDDGYEFVDLKRAFEVARNDSFSWLLKDVLKPDNIQRLLIKGDKQTNGLANSSAGTNFANNQPNPIEDPNDWRSDAFWERFVHNGSGTGAAVAVAAK